MTQIITNPISQASCSIELEGFDYYFTSFSGIKVSKKTTTYPIGEAGGEEYEIPTGGIKREPFELKKPCQVPDWELFEALKDSCLTPRVLDLTIYEVCPDKPLYTLRFSGCYCLELEGFEFDLSSEDLVEQTYKFAWQSVERV